MRSGGQYCPVCLGRFEAVRFKPVEMQVLVPELAGVGPAASAPCARHARNRAEIACSRCGQFMCSLCRIDSDGQAFCPGCYERLADEGGVSAGLTKLWNWSGMATLTVLLSVPLWFTFILWIAGIVFCILGLREKAARNEKDGVAGLYILLLLNVLTGFFVVGVIVAMFGGFRS
jgi:uncharacterized paraquat-inducible protein A